MNYVILVNFLIPVVTIGIFIVSTHGLYSFVYNRDNKSTISCIYTLWLMSFLLSIYEADLFMLCYGCLWFVIGFAGAITKESEDRAELYLEDYNKTMKKKITQQPAK